MSHILSEFVLLQPDPVGIPGDEFIGGQAFNQLRSRDRFCLPLRKIAMKFFLRSRRSICVFFLILSHG